MQLAVTGVGKHAALLRELRKKQVSNR